MICYFLTGADGYWRRVRERREAEERGRHEWVSDVKRRLGLVCIGEIPFVIEWSPNPRCKCSFILNGERVSLSGPCPIHAAG